MIFLFILFIKCNHTYLLFADSLLSMVLLIDFMYDFQKKLTTNIRQINVVF